jgi:hypothetical protein
MKVTGVGESFILIFRAIIRGAVIARQASGVALLAGVLGAQATAPLENVGKPMLLPYRCTENDIQWAGLSCSAEEPCPMYLELTAVEAIGNKILAAGDIHSETVTLYSVLLGSDDAGRTWHEAHERIRGAGLDHIQFADFQNGWASGEALSPLPQEPFLLITSDGGKTWRQHAIFSEPRVGSIQQIRFNSKNDGSLVFDRGPGTGEERYELYQSHDAGESWNIQEARNQPIRLQDGAPAALWRVQAEGNTQSFRIEHHEGNRWIPAAAFAVNLGPCTPPSADSSPDPAAPAAAPQEAPRPAEPSRAPHAQ